MAQSLALYTNPHHHPPLVSFPANLGYLEEDSQSIVEASLPKGIERLYLPTWVWLGILNGEEFKLSWLLDIVASGIIISRGDAADQVCKDFTAGKGN